MSELQKLCDEKGIEIVVSPSDLPLPSGFTPGSSRYEVILLHKEGWIVTPFFQGPAIKEEPTTANVLYSLILDGTCYENAIDIDDFANKFGYTSVKEVLRSYNACKRMSREIRDFLGEDYELFANAEH